MPQSTSIPKFKVGASVTYKNYENIPVMGIITSAYKLLDFWTYQVHCPIMQRVDRMPEDQLIEVK
jgi:hypothetical protein